MHQLMWISRGGSWDNPWDYDKDITTYLRDVDMFFTDDFGRAFYNRYAPYHACSRD